MSNWLLELRQNNATPIQQVGATKKEAFVFQLQRFPYGVVIRAVNSKGEEVFPNFLDHAGVVRQLLYALGNLRERQDFVIDWENPERSVVLGEHPYLLNLLRQCALMVHDEAGNVLEFPEEKGKLLFRIDAPDADNLTARHILLFEEQLITDLTVVSEEVVWSGQQLITIAPLGLGYMHLPLFNATFDRGSLAFFLSLYYSQISSTSLRYDDYELRQSPDSIEAEPCLVFEKVDADKSLYLSIGQMLPGVSQQQMQNYPIHRYALVNDMERTVTVRPVVQQQYAQLVQTVEQLLQGKGRGRKAASGQYFREENLFIIEPELAAEFITENLPALLQSFRVMGAEQLREYKIVARPPKLNMKFSSGIDFLEGEVQVEFDNVSISLFDLIAQYRKQKYVLLADGNKAIIDEQYVRRLERIFKQKGKSQKVEMSLFDLPLAEDLINEVQGESPFKKSRKVFEGFNELSKAKAKMPKVNAKLRPYQTYGFKWLDYLREQRLGGCLADDMGLGKTLQAITVLAKVYAGGEERPSLVVCPRSLLQNWFKECAKFAPDLKVHIHYGQSRNWEEALQHQVIVTTYAIMRNDIETIREQQLCYAILDESQNIKNLEAQTTRAALLLKADHRLALSGTPIENHLGELYSLFRFLNPGMFGTPNQFLADYGNPIQRDNDPEATAQLRKKIFPFVLRRRKVDVLDDLPDKVEQTLYVDMSEEQQKLYEVRRAYYQNLIQQQVAMQGVEKSQFIIFQAMNELRQIATIPEQFSDGKITSSKKELLLEQLEEVLANGHKALIFVNFLAALEILSGELEKMGVDFVTMSGATRNRQALVDRFQEDPKCQVFLMTLKTGGTGLNLTAASTVFIYDPWWNVASENQAIDRTHRIGQVNKVHALRLIATGTIEEKIRLLQEQKQALFDSVIGADGASLKSMTEEDINFILGK